ncbi:MAG: alpha,alpha-trehalase TreF [Fidelibacterota bacterium]
MRSKFSIFAAAILGILMEGCQKPEPLSDDLFEAVQMNRVFADQKKFVDCIPLFDPDSISAIYRRQKDQPDFDLRRFVGQYYDTTLYCTDTVQILKQIEHLWDFLVRRPETEFRPYSSLILLPKPYIVPGGRFREIYYWDSYFTMLGLRESGEFMLIENMIENFACLVNEYGFVPNGNRCYYLSRSQPPFLALMIDLLSAVKGDSVYEKYLDILIAEYQFWMHGAVAAEERQTAVERVVFLETGELLNRYWDALQTPRPESFKHDVELFQRSDRDSGLFRDIRAAAESGWDFSTRWFADGRSLETIQTTEIIPVDLNCLLYHLEMTIAKALRIRGNFAEARWYENRAQQRRKLILKYCWNEEQGYFFDYNFNTSRQMTQYTLAGLFPLYFQMADTLQAMHVRRTIEEKFLAAGGLVTTITTATGQQWDYPNGWAPLQWIGYKACQNYGFDSLAREIAQRWIALSARVFFTTGKMNEKYDVINIHRPGGGGEYPLQDGFGWTNGVFLAMWNELH